MAVAEWAGTLVDWRAITSRPPKSVHPGSLSQSDVNQIYIR